MHPILADSIGPNPLWILVPLAGIACTVSALVGLFPAALGQVRLAMVMAAPAFLFSLIITVGLFVMLATSGLGEDTDAGINFFVRIWIFLCGIPLAVSLIVWRFALHRRRTRTPPAP